MHIVGNTVLTTVQLLGKSFIAALGNGKTSPCQVKDIIAGYLDMTRGLQVSTIANVFFIMTNYFNYIEININIV